MTPPKRQDKDNPLSKKPSNQHKPQLMKLSHRELKTTMIPYIKALMEKDGEHE